VCAVVNGTAENKGKAKVMSSFDITEVDGGINNEMN
jgi:hypothetical protein